MTVHKSQGLTLDKAVIDLGEKDFTPGLSFVALSQVKTLSGLLFKNSFLIGHLQKPQGSSEDLDTHTECQDHSAQLQILSVWVGARLAQPVSLSNY